LPRLGVIAALVRRDYLVQRSYRLPLLPHPFFWVAEPLPFSFLAPPLRPARKPPVFSLHARAVHRRGDGRPERSAELLRVRLDRHRDHHRLAGSEWRGSAPASPGAAPPGASTRHTA